MNPETIIQILNAVKECWNFLYEIAAKQIYFELITKSFWGILALIYIIFYISTAIKTIKYNPYLMKHEKGYSAFYDWLKGDDYEGLIMFLWGLGGVCIIISVVDVGLAIDYVSNFLINPDYLIYKQVIDMLPVISQ